MNKKVLIKKKEIETGVKRVNMSLLLSDYENLVYCSDSQSLKPGTLAQSWVAQRARKESEALVNAKYVPKKNRSDDLFSAERKEK